MATRRRTTRRVGNNTLVTQAVTNPTRTISPRGTSAPSNTNTVGNQEIRRQQRRILQNEETPIVDLPDNTTSARRRVRGERDGGLLTRYNRRTTTSPDVQPRVSIGVRVPGNERPRRNDTQYSNDVLNVAEYKIDNDNFQLIDSSGISAFRPEIIALTDFKPVYEKDNAINIIGEYIDFQYQVLNLRRDTLVEMLSAINEWSPKEIEASIASMTNDFRASLDRTQRTINSYVSYINTIENIKNSINMKSLAVSKPTTSPRNKINVRTQNLQSFFEKNLQYPKPQFDIFSNTKIYLQFISDLRSIVENYSFGLLSLTDPDRVNDFNPIDIDNSYTTKDGFTFSIDTLRSSTTAKNFTQSSYFNQFLNSLPKNTDDRIKLLITTLSKELRVSKNLANKQLQQKLADKFGSAPGTGADGTGNPFDNIFGIPGDTIFEAPVGDNSLASLDYINFNNSFSKIKFENK